jgi:tryptophan synthase beta subunit
MAALSKLPVDRTGRKLIGVCLSGRGDKDLTTVLNAQAGHKA